MMAKIATRAVLTLLICATGYADGVSWGPATLSDNNGGAFLSGFSIFTSGTTWILNLPNFSQSDFASFSGEVSLSVSADDVFPGIVGVMFEYSGTIDQTFGPASVQYLQTASGSPDQSGDFTTTPFSGFFARSASNHIDLTTTIDLSDFGGSAGINRIEFNLATVPEPSSLPSVIMLTAGLGLAWRIRRRKK